jgi:hypothetical protein
MATKIRGLDDVKDLLGIDKGESVGSFISESLDKGKRKISQQTDDFICDRYEGIKEYLDEHQNIPDKERQGLEKVENMLEEEINKRGLDM